MFGRGNRRKIPYKQGTLLDALMGEAIRKWDELSESIRPSEYAVKVKTKGRGSLLVKTRKTSRFNLWIQEDEEPLCLTGSDLRLLRFIESKDSSLLCVLHHEI